MGVGWVLGNANDGFSMPQVRPVRLWMRGVWNSALWVAVWALPAIFQTSAHESLTFFRHVVFGLVRELWRPVSLQRLVRFAPKLNRVKAGVLNFMDLLS